jgi:hypothetical protein
MMLLASGAEGYLTVSRQLEQEKVDVREPEPKSGLSFSQLCLKRSLHFIRES